MISNLDSTIDLFRYYKSLGEKAMAQVNDESLFWMPDEKSNSITVIVKHLHGNMLSRWTNFLTSDGEKQWRNRDDEFEETLKSRDAVISLWNEGWDLLFNTLNSLQPEDFEKTVYIRNMGQSAAEAIIRQLAHYAYHVGQIVYLCRLANEGDWKSLTIPKGGSKTYNDQKLAQEKRDENFTNEFLKK